MGVLYTVWPLGDDIRDWVRDASGQDVPAVNGRHPTPAEFRQAVADLPNVAVEYYWSPPPQAHAWQALVSSSAGQDDGPWTLANFWKFTSEEEQSELSFEKGWPELIVQIVARLASRAGPLVLIPDTGCAPLVVGPYDDPVSLVTWWEHARRSN